MAATGTAEPELAAALAVAAWRTIHLEAIRAILAGEDPAGVAARYPHQIGAAFSAVGQITPAGIEIATRLPHHPAAIPPIAEHHQ